MPRGLGAVELGGGAAVTAPAVSLEHWKETQATLIDDGEQKGPDGILRQLMNVLRRGIENGRGEMMSYCGDSSRCPGTTRWPSITTWDILFDTLPAR